MDATPLEKYTSARRSAVEGAIDAGLHLKRDVNAFVVERVQHLDPAEERLLGQLHRSADDSFESWHKKREDAEALVARAPRGHYILLRHIPGDTAAIDVRISDGRGIATGGKYDLHETQPVWTDLMRSVVEYEIYTTRRTLEQEREAAEDLAVVEEFDFTAGRQFKAVTIGGSSFSTIEINAINDKTGMIDLKLTKRGSAKEYTSSLRASDLAKMAGLQRGLPSIMRI